MVSPDLIQKFVGRAVVLDYEAFGGTMMSAKGVLTNVDQDGGVCVVSPTKVWFVEKKQILNIRVKLDHEENGDTSRMRRSKEAYGRFIGGDVQ